MKRTANVRRSATLIGSTVPLLAFVALMHAGFAGAQECGSLENGFGPFDYRHATVHETTIVEKNHFNADVEALRSGMTSSLGGDITYTLRALPNHPRALWAMVRLARKEHTNKPHGSQYTVDCWFERATRFVPDDGEVRLLYGLWLASTGDKKAATTQLNEARALFDLDERQKQDANLLYNLGLGYFDVGRYDEAVALAKRAHALGFPLNGLENKLRQANKWPQ
ncbi:MAG TPA: hypothetical protein VF132_12910 [Rudaea sp.]